MRTLRRSRLTLLLLALSALAAVETTTVPGQVRAPGGRIGTEGPITADPNGTFTGLPFGSPGARTVTVCPDGSCDATVICDADCTSLTSSCAAGSALAQRATLGTDPVEIRVGPGSYDECVRMNRPHSNTRLLGAGIDISTVGVVIDPSDCTPVGGCSGETTGSAVTLAAEDDPNGVLENVEVSGFTFRNDTWKLGGEAALMVGPNRTASTGEGCDGLDFHDIFIHDNKMVGNRVGLYVRGYTGDCVAPIGTLDPADAPAKENLPDVFIWNNLIVSGTEGLALKGMERVWSRDNIIRSQTNYVETVDPGGFLGERKGRIRKDANATWSEVFLDPADDPSGVLEATNFYVGRRVTLSDNADPNTACDSQCVGRDYYVWNHDNSDNSLDLFSQFGDGQAADFCAGHADPNGFPTTGCDYTIHAVGDPNNVGYRDSDWTIMRAASNGASGPSNTPHGSEADNRGWWEQAGIGFARSSSATNDGRVRPQSWEHVFSHGDRVEVVVNDFGPHSWNDRSDCRDRHSFLGGVLIYDEPVYKAYFEDLSIHIELNHDLPPPEKDPHGALDCPDHLGAFHNPDVNIHGYLVDALLSGAIRIDNAADDDVDIYGVRLASADPDTDGTLRIPSLDLNVTSTVDSYTGTVTHLSADNGETLRIGRITRSDDDPNVSGIVLTDPNNNIDLMPGGESFGSATIDPNSLTNTCETLSPTLSVPGARAGDDCSITDSDGDVGASYKCRVTADGVVTAVFCATGTVDPASQVLRARVTGR